MNSVMPRPSFQLGAVALIFHRLFEFSAGTNADEEIGVETAQQLRIAASALHLPTKLWLSGSQNNRSCKNSEIK